jgi:hypothetical protein
MDAMEDVEDKLDSDGRAQADAQEGSGMILILLLGSLLALDGLVARMEE